MLDSWSIFARNGKKNPVYFIRKIENRAGEIIEEYTHEENESETEQVISEDTSFLITSLLKSVVDYGTGQKVKSLGRPVAGKTGTTNDYKDAWFIGYVPQMITGVWVGFDQDHPIGRNETGSKAAVPIWLNYMKEATKDLEVKEFVPPNSVVRVAIDAETGDLPSPKTKKRVFEYFAEGTAPGELSPNDPTGTLMNKPTIVTGHAGLSSQLNVDVEDEEDADEILRQEF